MTTAQNPFSDPSIPSLAWVRDEVSRRYDLAHQLRMDLVSACNSAGLWFDMDLATIPANAAFLRKKFERLHPAHIGCSRRRIDNVKSLLLRAFREVGLSTRLKSYQCPLTPEWQQLFDQIEDRYVRVALSRLLRFCSRQGIAPGDVDDAVMARFLEALEQESLVKNPRTTHQVACGCWNKAAAAIPEWPRRTVSKPRYEDRIYALSDEAFHPDLLVDIERYIDHLRGQDLLNGPPKPFRPASLRSVRGHLRRFLSALHYSGFDIGSVRRLREIAEFELFRRGIEWMIARNGGQSSQSIGQTAWVIRVLAVKYCGVDREAQSLFDRTVSKLRVRHRGLSPKNRKAIQQFDDRDAVQRLLLCPERRSEKARRSSRKEARILAESAVAIELLIYAPIRMKNLNQIQRGKHLRWVGDRLHLSFEEQEVKNEEPLHFILPRFVSDRIRHFLEHYHGQYLSEPNLHLFAGRQGRPKDESCLRRMVKKALFEETGISLTPHQFRHTAAKLLLDQKPGFYEVARKVLGHKRVSTVYEHYAGAETQAAVDLYDEVIVGLKAEPQNRDTGASARSRGRDKSVPPFMDPLNLFGKEGRR